MDLIWLAVAGACIWFGILLLPWRPWVTGEFVDADPDLPAQDLSDITVLIPARDEAEVIEATMSGLKAQRSDLRIILVDDRSTDGTARIARGLIKTNLLIVSGEPRPPGWSGKLWALEQGIKHVDTELLLLLDADIELSPGILPALRKKMLKNNLQFVSLMAALRMEGLWERLLMPAFIYFFRLLYPFRLSNSTFPWVAAAAGGCILLKTDVLREMGGFKSVRGELIDDCALARRAKSSGHRTWIGLSHSVRSLRPYDRLKTIWDMVARTAFNQLRYSILLLVLCTALMIVGFWVPIAGLLFPGPATKIVSAGALCVMMLLYLPTLKFYGLSWAWAFFLPMIGTLYLAMTWTSAIRFWQGKGPVWKGRAYRPGQNR